MPLDSVVSPQVLNKYLILAIILVDVKSERFKYQSGRAGDEARKHKSPTKAGELASMHSTITAVWSAQHYIVPKYCH